MNLLKKSRLLILIVLCSLMVFAFPLGALASDEIPEVTIPDSVTNIVPPASDISDNPNYGEGSTFNMSALRGLMLASSNSVSGSCDISKLSSTSVNISGYSAYPTSDPAIRVTLMLQAYYDNSWHTLATKYSFCTGTNVSLSQVYNVTSGYYYRTKAYHSIADGTSKTSYSTSVLVE